MIVSITCRNGTNSNINRSNLDRQLNKLSKYEQAITRAQVVFSRESHHRHSDDLVTCHMSVSLPGKRNIDVYERQPSEVQAFGVAHERAIQQLARSGHSWKSTRKSALFNSCEGVSL